jgi:hypothetical protein
MNNFTADTEICDKCGNEISGEVCVNCYTKEDQSFNSHTPAEVSSRLVLVGFFLLIFSAAYIPLSDIFQMNNVFRTIVYIIAFLSIYTIYLAFLFILLTFKLISVETLNRMNFTARFIKYMTTKST